MRSAILTKAQLVAMLSASVAVLSMAMETAYADSTTEAAASEASAGDGSQLDEVIVTGQFRKEKLEDTPLSITALSSDTLATKGIENLRDITPLVPGVYLAPAPLTHTTASYFIRGIGESDSIANQTVVTYVDDVYTARPIGGAFELNDLESVQILRGPQGTLYGRNSSAGAIVVTTKVPTDTVSGFAEIGGGNYQAYTVRAGISGPISAGLLDGSVSVIRRSREGLVEDATNDIRVGTISTDGIRAKLNFTPTGWASYLLTYTYFQDYSTPTPLISRLTPALTPNTDPNTNYSNVNIYNRTHLFSASLRQTYDLGGAGTLEAITGMGEFKQPGLYDQDGGISQINETFSDHRDIDWSQEFRYVYDGSRVHVSSGVFLLYDNFQSYRTNFSPTAQYALLTPDVVYYTPPLPVGVAPGRTALQNSGEKTYNVAGYGQVTFDITTQLHLTLGERYTVEKHKFQFQGNEQVDPTLPGSPYLDPIYTIHEEHTWSANTPKVDLDFDLNPNLTAYAYYAEGFKAGGFDGRAPTIIDAEKPYSPEYNHTWETGLKSQLFDRRLTANLALFHNTVDGYQATVADINLISHRINLDQVRTQGFELETTAKPLRALTWINNLSFLSTRILSVGAEAAAVVAGQIQGKQIPYAPRWQYYSSADYELPFSAGHYHVGAEFIYRSAFFYDLPNTPAAAGSSQDLFNLSASYQPDKHWNVSINLYNVADRRFQQGGLVGNGVTTADATTYNEPRLVFLRARYSF